MKTSRLTPSRLVYIITDATIRGLKPSKTTTTKTKGNPPTGSKPSIFSGLADRYASTSKALASKRAKKQNQRRVTYLLGQKSSVPYTRWIDIFSGVANRYASTSKALARVIKFHYYSLQAAQKSKKTKPTKGNLPTGSKVLRSLHQMDRHFFWCGEPLCLNK